MSNAAAKIAQVREMLLVGKAEQARILAQRLLNDAPGDARVHDLMAQILIHLKRSEQGEHFARQAVALEPQDLGLRHNLAVTLLTLGKADEAATLLESIVTLEPGRIDSRMALISSRLTARRHHQVMRLCESSDPFSTPVLRGIRASALLSLGFAQESYEQVRSICHEVPDFASAQSTLALTSNYLDAITREQVFADHRAYGDLLARIAPAPRRPFPCVRIPERKLRVGLLSPDLRTHSVAYFIEPFVQGHDRAGYEIIAYQTNRIEDAMTARLKRGVSIWRDASALADAALFEQIRADRVDILIELTGHMLGHRLPVLHMRAAPVQITAIGYPNTTGVPAIDARLVDSWTDPPGEADAFATESLIRLDPCFLCYRPPAEAPQPTRLPHDTVTFGCFNAMQKYSPRLLRLWARVMNAVPDARLLLKSWNLADREGWDAFLSRCRDAGMNPDRIDLREPVEGVGEHLASYGAIDIALDTYPYHGTTTTCEAMWMGVPVVTLAGDRHAARVGVSLLHAVGLEDLIANDEEAYVRLAADLARDAARRTGLRTTLRERVRTSPLCDEPAYCRRFEAAIRTLWRAWCEKPA